MPHGPKKWFMLQIWRIQQVSQIVTLALLSLNLAGILYPFFQHRGGIFETPYTGIPPILLTIALSIWLFSIMWDLQLKMWRDQATVLVERNPYSKEKMSAKEIMIYGILWLPVLENLGKTDPKAKAAADALREWIKKASREEEVMIKDLDDIFKYIGIGKDELMGFNNKK